MYLIKFNIVMYKSNAHLHWILRLHVGGSEV